MKRIAYLLIVAFCATPLYSHPGRLDANGGHNGPGGYHYHRSPPPSSSSSPSTASNDDEILTKTEDISSVQTLLKELGFYSGEITGIADAPTLESANRARIQYRLPGTRDSIRRSLHLRLITESIGL